MTTDIFGRVLISDGEAVDPDDLNDMSRRTLASLWDQFAFASLPREAFLGDYDTAFTPTSMSPYAFALTVGDGRPTQGSGNNKIKITAGTLMQAIGSINGSEPQLLAFTFTGSDEVTIANGSVNPRVDLVQMKLEYVEDAATARDFQDAVTRALTSSPSVNKRRRIKCTLSVKQGSPAASPFYPIPDVGNVAIAGVLVGASYAAAGDFASSDSASASVAVLHDQRMPINVRPHSSHASQWCYSATFFDNTANQKVERNATGGSGNIAMLCPVVAKGRLIEIDCAFKDASTESSKLGTIHLGTGVVTALNGANLDGSGSGQLSLVRGQPLDFQTRHIPVVGPTIIAAGNGMGVPVWANGKRNPEVQTTGANRNFLDFPVVPTSLCLEYEVVTTATFFTRVTFYVAEGM